MKKENFRVYENGKLQTVSQFGKEDTPITAGLVLDDSGSMMSKRARVEAAALAMVRESNPQDEVFGTVFEIAPDGKESILHDFCTGDCSDGAYPLAGLIIDAKGNLYGTASAGGVNRNGTVFMITP